MKPCEFFTCGDIHDITDVLSKIVLKTATSWLACKLNFLNEFFLLL